MKTSKKPERDYIKSWEVNGTRYNRLRGYKGHAEVKLPNGDRYGREVQAAAKAAREAIDMLRDAEPAVDKKKRGDTLGVALSRYFDTETFAALRKSTRDKRRYILIALGKRYGDCILSELTDETIDKWLLAREATPSAARNLLVALQHLFAERVGAGLMKKRNNPMIGVRLPKRMTQRISKGHYPTWTHDHVDQFRAHWQTGTMERLAFELMLLTGMAVADVIRFSRGWVGKNGLISGERMKTGSKFVQAFTRELQAAIAACPLATPDDKLSAKTPILRDQLGRIWYAPGGPLTGQKGDEGWRNQDFSQWFSKACRAAELPEGIAAHGVRKRAACDDCLKSWPQAKLMGKFGWDDPKEVVLYTLEAQKELFMLEEVAKDAAD